MDVFKEASRQKVRIATNKGALSVEQLFDLSLTELDKLAVKLHEEHDTSGAKSFIRKTSTKDKLTKLRFDVVLDVLQTLNKESEEAKDKLETKTHNTKIDRLIAAKQDAELANKSLEELEALRK